MSLDVYVYDKNFQRRVCHHCESEYEIQEELFTANITHNLTKMARSAGIYKALWRPEELGAKIARQLVQPLTEGLERLKANPDHFRELNPSNGWGDYDGLIVFVESYLNACIDNPDAEITICR